MGTAASALLVRVAGLETVGCVQDFRKTRERLTEVEEDLRLRVADLMAELDAERYAPALFHAPRFVVARRSAHRVAVPMAVALCVRVLLWLRDHVAQCEGA